MKSTTVRILRVLHRGLSIAPPLADRLLEYYFTRPRPFAVSSRDAAVMSQARRWRAPYGQGTLQVYDWDAKASASDALPRTVLLVHGWSSRASQLAPFVEPLRSRGFRVVAFDGPSHGESDGRRSHLPEFAFALEALAGQLGPLYGVVGHSLGTAATTLALSRSMRAERLAYVAPPEDLAGYLARLARLLGFRSGIAARTQRRLEARIGVDFEAARGRCLGPDRSEPLWVAHDLEDREVAFAEGEALFEAWAGPKQRLETQGLGHNRLLRASEVIDGVIAHMLEGLDAEQPAPRVA